MRLALLTIALLGGLFAASTSAQSYFVGEIRPVALDFEPRGWARCDGRLLPITQYTALFALLGTTYGGNGKLIGAGISAIALGGAAMRIGNIFSRLIGVGSGQGSGLANVILGDKPDAPLASPCGINNADYGTLGVTYIIALQGIFPSRPS
ncbi:hypothetical protein HDU93_006030 [Gonapodya sp. JEL0774]|nr:hypothetical protein HDU93_006030 [Gonapodya sp. JEL0774]